MPVANNRQATGGIATCAGPSNAASHAGCRIVTAKSAAEAEKHRDAWLDLAARAVEPNIFYEPWNLLPALQTVSKDDSIVLLFVYTQDFGAWRLIGFFPLQFRNRYKGMRVRHQRLLQHRHCFLCTPLVDAGFVDRSLQAFAEWAGRHACRPMLELDRVSATLGQHLQRHFREQALCVTVTQRHERALWRPAKDANSYLKQALPNKVRKEYRRQYRRLCDTGNIRFRCLTRDDAAEPWIQSFLALEKRGWKGREGTALACSDADRRYFELAAGSAHSLGRLQMLGLFRNGEAIALSCKFDAGDGSFAFKITYDEMYRKYSPGMQLELEYVVRAHRGASSRWMDSCATPDHFMANRLWQDRRSVETLVVSGSLYGRLLVIVISLLKQGIALLRTPATASIRSDSEAPA